MTTRLAPTGTRTITADRGDAGRRVDLVIRRALGDVHGATRTRIQGWIDGGQVRVNGLVVRRPSSRVALGDTVTVALAEARPRVIEQADMRLDVLYEDDGLLAINKPPGLVAHPTHAHAGNTLLNALAGYARAWPGGQRPSLVNRLDKLTSGVVLVARTAAMHAALQRALTAPGGVKDYLAVVYGRPPARGTIELRLRRDARDRRRVTASTTEGAASVTRFERVSYRRVGKGTPLAVLRCRLITGRTHQIRAHLASSGWPIAGDPVYGEPRWVTIEDASLRELLRTFPRQALHAWRMAFAHPVTGSVVRIEAAPPSDLAALLAEAGAPWPGQEGGRWAAR